MRYTFRLRSSHQSHILKKHRRSTIIQAVMILIALSVLATIVGVSNLSGRDFFEGFWFSFLRVSSAYVISLMLALVLAFVITFRRRLENLLLPLFDVLQSFPSFALIPLLVASFQSSPSIAVVAVLVMAMIWPLLFGIITALKNRREDLDEAAKIYGATGWHYLRRVTLPELFPAIITGSIIAWGDAWDLLIGAELLVVVGLGVGRYLGLLGEHHQNGLLAFGIVAYLGILFIINKIIWLPLLRRATKYQTES